MKNIQIVSTFTANPIERVLLFWENFWKWDIEATYVVNNQPLLDSSAYESKNSLLNVFLLRLDDWLYYKNNLSQVISIEQKKELLLSYQTTRLPNQLEIAYLHHYETEYLYREIFVEKTYVKQGIVLVELVDSYLAPMNIMMCRITRIIHFASAKKAALWRWIIVGVENISWRMDSRPR